MEDMPSLGHELSAPIVRDADRYREAFLHASPFKHVVIDEFFEPKFARELLAEFPSFNSGASTNEVGRKEGKAVQTDISKISPAYRTLYDVISGRMFLDFVSRLSGIRDLQIDKEMFGGGTHENLHGQELDPHVDFNYDQSRQLHRRLNLIVYLNPEWQPEWGGALEVHSNPRATWENRITSYDPLFNRCVMFETNEYSWHGFPRINLPEDRRHLSRKSISIYLYTKDRPAEEIAPAHSTFYVQRPLPPLFTAGHTLSNADMEELQRLLIRRDEWINLYQKMELHKSRDFDQLSTYVQHLVARPSVPLTGYVLHEGAQVGLYGDGWAASNVSLRLRALMPVTKIVLRGFRPKTAPSTQMTISIDGAPVVRQSISESFEVAAPLPKKMAETFQLEISCDGPRNWAASSGDDRDLGYLLTEVRALHPGCASPA
jgi:hypothetical protein